MDPRNRIIDHYTQVFFRQIRHGSPFFLVVCRISSFFGFTQLLVMQIRLSHVPDLPYLFLSPSYFLSLCDPLSLYSFDFISLTSFIFFFFSLISGARRLLHSSPPPYLASLRGVYTFSYFSYRGVFAFKILPFSLFFCSFPVIKTVLF